MEKQITVMTHPLIKHKISMIRDKNTGVKEFREMVSEISMLMLFEATRDMPLKSVEIETPLGMARAQFISGKKLAVVPILRAGLGMVEGVLNLIPAVKIGHIGEYRDPASLKPISYYCKLPADIKEREAIILDPMLATGGTLCHAIQLIKDAGCTKIKIMAIIACKEGLKQVSEAHPDVEILVGEVDEKLNEQGYIVPGLGDAGDRMFGTK